MEQIAENLYLQDFFGLTAYQHKAPFHHSRLIADAQPTTDAPPTPDIVEVKGEDKPAPPNGQLVIDATCVPADITYPTDLKLLNGAREKTEEIIDHVHTCRTSPTKRPRTYRQKARQAYLRVSKAIKPGRRKRRQCR